MTLVVRTSYQPEDSRVRIGADRNPGVLRAHGSFENSGREKSEERNYHRSVCPIAEPETSTMSTLKKRSVSYKQLCAKRSEKSLSRAFLGLLRFLRKR